MFLMCVVSLLVCRLAQTSPVKPPDATPPIYSEPQLSYGDGGGDFPSAPPAPAAPVRPQVPPRTPGRPAPSLGDDSDPPKYAFDYAVQDAYSGASYSQQEKRDGYDTQGSYYVALPDGRTQKVTYYVNGDSGYVPEVEYEGQAQFPQAKDQGYAR